MRHCCYLHNWLNIPLACVFGFSRSHVFTNSAGLLPDFRKTEFQNEQHRFKTEQDIDKNRSYTLFLKAKKPPENHKSYGYQKGYCDNEKQYGNSTPDY